jgi:hypothetical protein
LLHMLDAFHEQREVASPTSQTGRGYELPRSSGAI